MKISVEVNGVQETRLEDIARRLNVRVEDLASAAVHDLLARQDDDFLKAASRVLKKNQELYRRLS